MKRCPYCDEDVRDNAVKCRHCGSMLGSKDVDTLDRSVTLADAGLRPQYDTLDVNATRGGEQTVLGGQYRIINRIGKGGMGVVYLAEDMEMGDRPVAIKVLPPELADSVSAVENLRREAITAIDLNHTNIIRLHGFHSDGDIKFLVMECVRGQTLEMKIAKSPDGRLGLDETIDIAAKVAAALNYAHGRKTPVFHRDLKPSNIMISEDGEVKLLDFGIAREMKDSYTRVTGRQDTSGTLPYMSPEQLRGKRPTAAMDIYALGVVCYECLSGHPPFHTGEISYQIINEPPADLESVPDQVNKALQTALSKDPGERPGTAGALIDLLRARSVSKSKPRKEQAVVPARAAPLLPCAVAPYSSERATEYQRQTAEALGVHVDRSMDLGGGVKLDLVLIPAGEFTIGSPQSEKERSSNEGPQHLVRLTKPFYMGVTEVTQAQWKAVMESNPSNFMGDDLPVETVSWDDAVEFCRKLSDKEGRDYRLPTEAEWEYACRAGSTARFCFGDSKSSLGDYAWYSNNSGGKTHPVKSKKLNAFGLYDMHGNVWEWCSDWYGSGYYSKTPASDPQGPSTGRSRVVRGGSWYYAPRYCRSANRGYNAPGSRSYSSGFRVVVLDFQK